MIRAQPLCSGLNLVARKALRRCTFGEFESLTVASRRR
jgi:hypothetical protein